MSRGGALKLQENTAWSQAYLMQTEPHFRCLLKMDQEMNQDANPRGMLCNQLNEARSTHVLKRIVVFGKLKISIYKNVHFRFEYLYVRNVQFCTLIHVYSYTL